jgi:hypothetical protein
VASHVAAIVFAAGAGVWTAICIGDAAWHARLSGWQRAAWILALLGAPWIAALLATIAVGPMTAVLVFATVLLAMPCLFTLAVRVRLDGLKLWSSLGKAWWATSAASRRAWVGHLALIALLCIFYGWWVPQLERVYKDFGGAFPGPTQLIIDVSHAFRRGWVFTVLGFAGVYLLDRCFLAAIRLGRESEAPGRAFTQTVNVVMVAYLLFFAGVAAVLPVFSLALHLK